MHINGGFLIIGLLATVKRIPAASSLLFLLGSPCLECGDILIVCNPRVDIGCDVHRVYYCSFTHAVFRCVSVHLQCRRYLCMP